MSSSDTSSSPSVSESPRGVKRKREDVLKSGLATARKDTSEPPNEAESSSSESRPGSSDESDKNDGDTLKEFQVLSHAAQRKLRKKDQGKFQGAHPSSESSAIEVTPKRQHSVWVGNLAFKTTEQSLRAFFQRGVPGCEVTRVHLPMKTGKEFGGGNKIRADNRGFAYVDFATKDVKEQAIALSEQNLDGRKLLIKDGTDFTGRPTAAGSGSATAGTAAHSTIGKSKTAQRILAAQKQPPAPTLFLGNLGFQATEESIRSMLNAHMSSLRQDAKKVSLKGEGDEAKVKDGKKWLRKIRMGTFEDSGLCKGWAFLDFHNIEDATSALLDTRNHHLDGRKLVIEYASAEAVRRGGGSGAREHRANTYSKGKGDTTPTTNRLRGEPNSQDKIQGKPGVQDTEDQGEPLQKKSKPWDRKERQHGTQGRRMKPGGALALAKREKVAIVPSSGKKIIF